MVLLASMVRLLLLLFAILLMVIHATSTTTQRNYLVVLLTSDGSSHDLHSLPTSSPDSSRPFRVAWTTTTGLSSIKYIDQSTFDGVANQLFAPTPSQTKSFPCLNVTTVLATLTQVWTNNTIDSSLFILIDRRLSFCISNNSLNNQWQSPQQEELMDDIMLHFKSSFNLITSPDITIPTSIRRLSTSTGGYHYRIQPNIATKVSQIIVVHHQTPYKWFEHKFNDASTITLNLYNKVIKNVVMISNNRIFASPSPTRSIEITSRQFMYTFDNPSTPVISFLVLNIDGIKPNVYAAVDQPAIRNLKFYPYIKSTRKSPLLLHNPIDGLPNYIQFTAPLQLQFKTLDLVDSVNKRVLVHIPSSKVTKEDQNQEVNYKAGPVLIPNQYFTIKLRATNALGSIYMPTNKPIQNRLIVTQQNRSAYIPCNPSMFARLRFPKIQFQKQWLSNVKDGLVTPESSRNKDLLYFKQVNSLNEGIYTCTISNRNDTIEYHPYYLIAADKFTRNRRTVEKGEYVEIRCSSKQGFAILLHNNKIIWTKSSISHQGIIGRNLTIGIQITESSNDIYTCRTIKQQSFEEDTTRILSTGTLTPRINAYPDMITAYFGEDTFLFCNSTLPVRVWRIYVDGQFLKVTKTADVMLLISAAQLANLTHYTCEAEYPSGNILRLDVPLVILDGEWTLWSPWSSCSKTCGQSFKKRRRHCLLSNGLLSNELSTKKPCKGDDISTEVCTYRGCDPSNQQPVPSSVITGNIEAIVDKKRSNISVNIVAVEKEDFTLFTIVTSKVPLQFLKHFLVILPSLSSVNWVYGKSLNSAVSRQEFKGRKFRRKMSIYYKDGFFTSTVINIAGSPMVFEASLDGFINNDQSYDLVRARRVRECFIRSNLKTLSWYLADNCSDPSSGFRDEASFTGFGSIDYDFHQEPATFLFEVGQYDILNWKDVNDSLIIEISGFIAKYINQQCPKGFVERYPFCQDIDECSIYRGGKCSHICHNTVGSYYCSCPSGFAMNSDRISCRDLDECLMNQSICSIDYRCVNTPGSYNCIAKCQQGYRFNAEERRCQDINECLSSPCGENQDCINTRGSYECLCRPGYIENGRHCIDLDECSLNPPRCKYLCINLPGSYRCACKPGYQPIPQDPDDCWDVNECEQKPSPCSGKCYNTLGSYYCGCIKPGFTTNLLGECEDINECEQNPSPCPANCRNTLGSYFCLCNKRGYRSNNQGDCEDIDECSLGISRCSGRCYNYDGGYKCICDRGYLQVTGNRGSSCIKEDAERCYDKQCGYNSLCVKRNNISVCACKKGFKPYRNTDSCLDDDECRLEPCQYRCKETFGSYRCLCPPGFTVDHHLCKDIDECTSQNRPCNNNHICINTFGSYRCVPDRKSLCKLPSLYSAHLRTCIRFSHTAGVSILQSFDWIGLPLNTPANVSVFIINMKTFNHFFGSCINCTNQLSIRYRIIGGNNGHSFSLRGGSNYNMVVFTERQLITSNAEYPLQILTKVSRGFTEMHFYHNLTIFVSQFDF